MIEIKEVKKFLYITRSKNPHFIFFYKKEGNEILDEVNILLIKHLRSIENTYCDLPMIAFDYLEFTQFYIDHKLTSCKLYISYTKF